MYTPPAPGANAARKVNFRCAVDWGGPVTLGPPVGRWNFQNRVCWFPPQWFGAVCNGQKKPLIRVGNSSQKNVSLKRRKVSKSPRQKTAGPSAGAFLFCVAGATRLVVKSQVGGTKSAQQFVPKKLSIKTEKKQVIWPSNQNQVWPPGV